jgi:Enhancer of polycomb-like
MNRFSMRPHYRPKVRKRGKRQFWSRLSRKTFRRHVVHVLHLPTRNTLTVAEAQRFVDVETDGSVHRLDVGEPLPVISDVLCNNDDESPDYCEISQTNPAGHCHTSTWHKAEKASETDECSNLQNCFKPCVRIIEQQKEPLEEFHLPAAYCRRVEETVEKLDEDVEYDMDEQVLTL